MPCHHLLCVTPEHSVTAAAAPFTPRAPPPRPSPWQPLLTLCPLFWTCLASAAALRGLVRPASLTERHALMVRPHGTCRPLPPFHGPVWDTSCGCHLGCSHSCARVREWGSLRVSWEPTQGTAGPRDAVQPCVPETPGPAPGPRPAVGFPEAWRLRLAGTWRRRHRVTKAPPWTQSRRRRRLETPRSR